MGKIDFIFKKIINYLIKYVFMIFFWYILFYCCNMMSIRVIIGVGFVIGFLFFVWRFVII